LRRAPTTAGERNVARRWAAAARTGGRAAVGIMAAGQGLHRARAWRRLRADC